jgi:hypothetical protein
MVAVPAALACESCSQRPCFWLMQLIFRVKQPALIVGEAMGDD